MNTTSKRMLLALPIIILGTLSLLYFGALAPHIVPGWFSASLVSNVFVDEKLKYQIVTFGIALLVLTITYALAPQNAHHFYGFGTLDVSYSRADQMAGHQVHGSLGKGRSDLYRNRFACNWCVHLLQRRTSERPQAGECPSPAVRSAACSDECISRGRPSRA